MTARLAILLPCLLFASCVQTGLGGLEMGADCGGRDSNCRSGQCFVYDSGTSVCTASCSDAEPCPDGFLCDRTATRGRLCLPPGLGGRCERGDDCPAGHLCDLEEQRCYIPVGRELCGPCTSGQQCPEGGTCLEVAITGERYCTQPCDGGCPDGFRCEAVPGASEEQCVPDNELRTCGGARELCAPCQGHSECGLEDDLCVRNLASGESFCGESCTHESDCPTGFNCLDLSGEGSGPYQCVPNSGTCAGYCSSDEEDVVRRQCGLGASCDLEDNRCIPANDGRACAACEDDDDCSGTPGSRCFVNVCPDCPYQGEKYCATSCAGEDGAPDPSLCAVGFDCVEWMEGEAACVPASGTCEGGAGRLGDECTGRGGPGCVSGVCLGFGSRSLCSALCTESSDCGDARYHCCALTEDGEAFDCSVPPGEGGGVCAPRGGGFGADCSPGQPPCFEGACLDLGNSRLCTTLCDAGGECPGDFSCRDARRTASDGSYETVSVCFPDGGGEVGADCAFGPAACRSGYCIKKRTGNVCTVTCAADEECPNGWECRTTETVDDQTASVCVVRGLLEAPKEEAR